MKSLDLKNLKDNSKEILKAEMGALLFNLGKTHAEIKNWKDYLNIDDKFEKKYGYKDYYKETENDKSPFDIEVEKSGGNLRQFFDTNINLKIKGNSENNFSIKLRDVVKGDAGNNEFIKRVMFRGCENVNSGIDKGAPKKQLENLNIVNAFGATREEITNREKGITHKDRYDKSRLDFLGKLANQKALSDENLIEIREYVLQELEHWYSHLLSDTRFPINDVTLWDQAYMTASMFKASIASMCLEGKKFDEYIKKPNSIKWSILGIQYDKLRLAEKAMNPSFIRWYRTETDNVDKEIKKVIEEDYALGNEIYRDETGIYFIVPENLLGKNDKSDEYMYYLDDNLIEIQNDILNCFESFSEEVFPAVFLSKPSRGTMNIAYLLNAAKKNFLKPIYPKSDQIDKYFKEGESEGFKTVCDVCRVRLAENKNGDLNLCSICNNRDKKNKNKILNDSPEEQETVWTGELQDKNGRIVLLTLKFELDEWLNGDMLNTVLNNDTECVSKSGWREVLEKIKKLLGVLSRTEKKSVSEDEYILNKYRELPENFIETAKKFLLYFDEKGVYDPFEKIIESKDIFHLSKKYGPIFQKYFCEYLCTIFNGKLKGVDFNKKEIKTKEFGNEWPKGFENRKVVAKGIFSFSYITEQIKNILLERTIGDKWENFLQSKLKDKINFTERKISWDELEDKDIEFLAQILLQFIIRKNPSPARFRRIWESTKKFFEDIEKDMKNILGISDWRSKRIKFNNIVSEQYRGREFEYKGLNFVSDSKGNLYLISSIEQAIPLLNDYGIDDKDIKSEIETGSTDWIKKDEFILMDMENKDKYRIKLKNIEYVPYKPYISIISPTPVSWQFIIPAEYSVNILDYVRKKYNENFKYVQGKLPLHVGTVFQDYKKPLYIGIKALRNIRRDIYNWDSIKKIVSGKDLRRLFNADSEDDAEKLKEKYYSLYQMINNKNSDERQAYKFYLPKNRKEDENILLKDITNVNEKEEENYIVYPNTIDFEYLDVNTRRNDISYDYDKEAKRDIGYKRNRPYTWGEWSSFNKFKEHFFDEKEKDNKGKYINPKIRNKNKTSLQRMTSLIYTKLNDWKGEENQEGLKKFMLSAFVNTFELKDIEKKNCFAEILGVCGWDDLKNKTGSEFKFILYKFLDMYDFWHNCLKEV